MKITVLGAGNWGTTVALLLKGNGHAVRLWEYNSSLADKMAVTRENATYLPGVRIPDDIFVTSDITEAVDGTEMAAFVVPSSFIRATAGQIRESGALADDALLVSLAKGLEHSTLKTMTDEMAEELPDHKAVALSGPCIAGEVARKMPTTIVAASDDPAASEVVQDAFMTPEFRVYTSDDPLGVQFGGALKNIIAVAAGICDGLGFGTNAKSALMTRGIVEMSRFGMLLGAKAETFNGLSGIGDLMTTCISPHSRNRRLGEALVSGRPLQDILDDMVQVAEGVPTTKAVDEYARKNGIDMPITRQVYAVLFEGRSPREAVPQLMLRDRKSE